MAYNAAVKTGGVQLWAARQPHIKAGSANFPSLWLNASKQTVSAAVGNTLTASTGVWIGPNVTVSKQWLRNDSAISGATNNSYSVVTADSGKTVGVKIIATNRYSDAYLVANLPVLA